MAPVLACRLLAETLPEILDTFRPDICLYDAGVDPHAEDELGRLCLTDDGLFRRDMMVRLAHLRLPRFLLIY